MRETRGPLGLKVALWTPLHLRPHCSDNWDDEVTPQRPHFSHPVLVKILLAVGGGPNGEVAEVTRDGDQRGAIVLSPLPRGRINQDISICENPTLYVNPCLREQQAQRAGWFCMSHNDKKPENCVKSNCKWESCCLLTWALIKGKPCTGPPGPIDVFLILF